MKWGPCLNEPLLVLAPIEPQYEALLAGVDDSVSPEWSGKLDTIK